MHDRDEIDPVMRDGLAGLSRHRQPGRLLEERTVGALRSMGLLRRRGVHRAWWAAAAAAAVAFFASGYAIGQRSASLAFAETTAESQLVAMQAALQVQRTGSAWIAALNTLAELPDDADADAVRQGREAARAALRAAAIEFAGLEPADPVSTQLLWLLAEPADESPGQDARAVVWF
jgi:hypothetical protein